MSKITITGGSDDHIIIDGDIIEQFDWWSEEDETSYLAFSDGTLLSVIYDQDGIWKVLLIFLNKKESLKMILLILLHLKVILILNGF